MNVSLTSTFISSLQIHFQTMQNLCTVPFTTSILQDNFQFPIHCQVGGLVEMRFVWKDPTSKIFSFNKFSTSFVTHSLKTFIISNASCTSYACSFSTYKRISYDVFVFDLHAHRTDFLETKKWEPPLGKTTEQSNKKRSLKEVKKKSNLLLFVWSK